MEDYAFDIADSVIEIMKTNTQKRFASVKAQATKEISATKGAILKCVNTKSFNLGS